MNLESKGFHRAVTVLAWLCLLYIAFATLGPISSRPSTGFSPQIERVAAYALVGMLFALAYPRHIILAGLVVLGVAILLEVLQLVMPSRHGRLLDAGFKVAGSVVGLGAGRVFAKLAMRR
jgi:hypothetical protein